MTDSTAPAALTADGIDAHAAALRRARESRIPVPPLTDAVPGLTATDAYAIASRNVATDLAAGATAVGHKIGLTSPAVQQQLGVSSPDYGVLLDTMRIANGATVDAADYIAPRIELEVAFVLARPLAGPEVTSADVRRATAYVMPALELVDSRIADWRIRLADTVADAASGAGFVLGAGTAELGDIDVTDLSAELYGDGELVERGHSSAVLGDPCASVAWLANALAGFGETLAAGEVILSGACTRMAPVSPGTSFRGVVPGLGTVELAFGGATR